MSYRAASCLYQQLFSNVCTAYERPVEKDSSTEWKEGVNGYSFRAGLNTCMLWVKFLIFSGRVLYCLITA
jgi:hypothetical protein